MKARILGVYHLVLPQVQLNQLELEAHQQIRLVQVVSRIF